MNDEDNEMIPCLNGNIVVGFDNFIMLISENVRLKFDKKQIAEKIMAICQKHGMIDCYSFGYDFFLNSIDEELSRLNTIIKSQQEEKS